MRRAEPWAMALERRLRVSQLLRMLQGMGLGGRGRAGLKAEDARDLGFAARCGGGLDCTGRWPGSGPSLSY
jgi:hypothetical protein